MYTCKISLQQDVRYNDDIGKTVGTGWMRVAHNRHEWKLMKEAYAPFRSGRERVIEEDLLYKLRSS